MYNRVPVQTGAPAKAGDGYRSSQSKHENFRHRPFHGINPITRRVDTIQQNKVLPCLVYLTSGAEDRASMPILPLSSRAFWLAIARSGTFFLRKGQTLNVRMFHPYNTRRCRDISRIGPLRGGGGGGQPLRWIRTKKNVRS